MELSQNLKLPAIPLLTEKDAAAVLAYDAFTAS